MTLGDDRRQHLALDQVGVSLGPVFCSPVDVTVEVARHDVGTEEGDGQLHRGQRRARCRSCELAQLLVDGEAVAGLDLQAWSRRRT